MQGKAGLRHLAGPLRYVISPIFEYLVWHRIPPLIAPSALTYPSALPFDERTASITDDGSYRSVDTFDNLFGYNATARQ